ncbi:hypothetical protein NliqN6_4041 [Naganishia liquefaciens]|uniref:Uncharacterized protein n=1 Tax=Naganishia liquefaciens TaxID=104408 RepID=A0A8H3YFH7_9TREE|nr:hypothetical protein NliqN6_4041 [Naganishia liquefaciens]
MLRQAIKEETPLILQTATEATLNAGTSSSSLAIGNMAANAARTAAVASVEAASSTTATGLGRMGAEVVSREAAGVMGETSVLSSHLAAVKQATSHANVSPLITNPIVVETALPHAVPQPSIAIATGSINPATLTCSIARQALSKPTTSAGRGSALARMDINLTQSAETIKEAISNAVQEGLEEQLDKAIEVQKVTMAAGSGPALV